MKLIMVILIFFSSLYAKQCYTSKHKKVCYYKYFDRKAIYKVKSDETYFLSQKNNIFAFTDKIEVKFKAFGAILSVLDNFEIEFFDKIKERYIFKVKYPNELFSIVSRLNELDTISKAVPVGIRKYTKNDVAIQAQKKKERLKRALEKSKSSSKSNTKAGTSKMGGPTTPTNFLNPDAK